MLGHMCWTYSGGHCGRHTSPCSESSQSCEDQLWGTAACDCHHSGLYLLHIHSIQQIEASSYGTMLLSCVVGRTQMQHSQQVLKKVYIYKNNWKVTQKWVHLIRLQPTELENKRPRQETEGHMATETNMLTTNTMTWQKSIWQMNTNTNRKQDTRHKAVYWKLYTKVLWKKSNNEM